MMKKVFALAMAGAMVVSMPVMAATSPTASAVASQAVVSSAAPSASAISGTSANRPFPPGPSCIRPLPTCWTPSTRMRTPLPRALPTAIRTAACC